MLLKIENSSDTQGSPLTIRQVGHMEICNNPVCC